MLMKKLSEEHYIVVDDSEIKIGDIVPERLLTGKYELFTIHTLNDIDRQTQKKVICSTQPLELICCTPVGQIKRYIDCKGCDRVTLGYNEVKPLSLSEVKELLGVVNVEKKVMELYNNFKLKPFEAMYPLEGATKRFVENVYNQALEDNKEKEFTREDMLRLLYWADSDARNIKGQKFEQFIQSLQPKTEWNVEIVEGKLKLKL